MLAPAQRSVAQPRGHQSSGDQEQAVSARALPVLRAAFALPHSLRLRNQSVSPTPRNSPPAGTSTTTDWRVTLLELVNQARKKVGLGPLCLNRALNAAAQGHSDDMALYQVITHVGYDGSDCSLRMERAGYRQLKGAGENIAWNSPNVRELFKGWMASDGHRVNILGQGFRHMGAGRADSNGPYWTQVSGQCGSKERGCSRASPPWLQ